MTISKRKVLFLKLIIILPIFSRNCLPHSATHDAAMRRLSRNAAQEYEPLA